METRKSCSNGYKNFGTECNEKAADLVEQEVAREEVREVEEAGLAGAVQFHLAGWGADSTSTSRTDFCMRRTTMRGWTHNHIRYRGKKRRRRVITHFVLGRSLVGR